MRAEHIFGFVIAIYMAGNEVDGNVAVDAMLDESIGPCGLRGRGTAYAQA